MAFHVVSQGRHPPEVALPQQTCPPRKMQVVAELTHSSRRVLQRPAPAPTGLPPAGFGNLCGDRDGCPAHPLSQTRIALHELPRHPVHVLGKIVRGVPGTRVSMVGPGHSNHAAQYARRMPGGHYLATHWSHRPMRGDRRRSSGDASGRGGRNGGGGNGAGGRRGGCPADPGAEGPHLGGLDVGAV